MMALMLRFLALGAAVTLAAGVALAHPSHGDPHVHDEAGHGHGHDHGHDEESPEPTAEQKKKRLERVLARAAERERTREQRRDDRRRALKKRLGRKLKDAPVSESITRELALHARRVASLRQIRDVAARENDFESVASVDRILAQENARHERWWRSHLAEAKR